MQRQPSSNLLQSMSDAELVACSVSGMNRAFDELVRRTRPGLLRGASHLLADRADAEEAVQEALLRAFRNRSSYRGEAAVSTWLHTICRNVCLEHVRRRRVPQVELEEARAMPARAGQDEAIYGGDFFDLQDAVAQLAPVERNAFLLVTVGGWSREEAAQLTGVPATTLRSRVSRATKRLAATIGDRALPVPALR